MQGRKSSGGCADSASSGSVGAPDDGGWQEVSEGLERDRGGPEMRHLWVRRLPLDRKIWSEYIDHISSREVPVPKKTRSMAKLLTSSATPAVPATLFKAKCAETMD